MFGRLRTLALGIPVDEASFERRGFCGGGARLTARLEQVGRTFIEGYLAALQHGRPEAVVQPLERIGPEFRGFAFEGAAMAFALLDGLTPWRADRVQDFIQGPGADHVYMAHVGIGWAFARLPHIRWRSQSFLARFDPQLRWLILDGYGFHQGYFHWRKFFLECSTPSGLSPYQQRAFDQGLGRCLWFVAGGDAGKAAAMIGAFPTRRQSDFWSGLGLACAYAGGCDLDGINTLRQAAGDFLPHMQQGAAFAAKARQRAGNPCAYTDMVCEVLCGMTSDEAAALSDQALQDLPPGGAEPAYETWRSRIRTYFCDRELVFAESGHPLDVVTENVLAASAREA